MTKLISIIAAVTLMFLSDAGFAYNFGGASYNYNSNQNGSTSASPTGVYLGSYGASICDTAGFYCYRVRSGDTWESLYPNLDQRDIVMRVNRVNMRLVAGMELAIPKNLERADIISVSPFAAKISAPGEKEVLVDLNKLAWAAYDAGGNLVHWGPASGGRGFCSDVSQSCYTVTGSFRVFRKQPAKCVSSVYPIQYDGGAPMPYCMHFFSGFAMHGSYEVPGYNASHGCVRMFINDARWLNEHFVSLGTRVVVQPYGQPTELTENDQ
jgi:lipoprotein-anchoring transpeptidase ErfK/SrfK